MPPIDLSKVNSDGPQYTPEYFALTAGKDLDGPIQDVPNPHSTQFKAPQDPIVQRVRGESNAKPPILRIPSEILSEIFLHCISDELTSDSLYPPRTFSFLRVCSYWKVVAYETPRMWSTWPGGCIDEWSILHVRSKNVPLDIHFRKRPTDFTALIPILSHPETFRRLRSLDFNGHASWLGQFLGLLLVQNHENAPNLETLRINVPWLSATLLHWVPKRISRFFALAFPKLQILEIANLDVDWSSSFPSLSSISELTIKNPRTVNQFKTPGLLSLLRNNPKINRLILEGTMLPHLGDTAGGSDPLKLSDLRNLQLTGGLFSITNLLEHLRLPPELQFASITLVDVTEFPNEALLPQITSLLRSYYLSEDHEERKIGGLRLRLDHLQTAELTIATTPNPFVVPEPTSSQIPPWPMNVHIHTDRDKRSLSIEVFQFLPLDNLCNLSLEHLEFTVQQWKLLFGQVQRVEELHVAGCSAPGAIAALELPSPLEKFWQATRYKGRAAGSPSNSYEQRVNPRGGKARSVSLPKLKNLLLYEVVFGPRGGEKKHKGIPRNKLESLARTRKKAGYGLQELAIRACVGFGESQVKECEMYVRTVVWDGDEGEDLAHGCYTHRRYYWDPDDFNPDEEDGAYDHVYGREPWGTTYDPDDLDDYPYF